MKKITLLGSTGSIGQSALDVIAGHPDKFRVAALVAGRNVRLLARQIVEFRPDVAAVHSRKEADALKRLLGPKNRVPVLYDETGILEAAAHDGADMVVSAISGAAGLTPTLAAIDAGIDIALANKATLVAAGSVVMKKAAGKKSAFFRWTANTAQFFNACRTEKENLKRIILTASGALFKILPEGAQSRDAGAGAPPSPMENGPENHDRFRLPHEQGAGSDRSPMAV